MAKHFGFNPYTGNGRFVFMNYIPEESAPAAEYARHLHDNGVNVYYDADGVGPTALIDVIKMEKCAGIVLIASKQSIKAQFILDQIQKAVYTRKPVLCVYYKEDVTDIDTLTKVYLASSRKVSAWNMEPEQALREVLSGARQMIEGNADFGDEGDDIIKTGDGVWQILSDSEVELKRYTSKEENYTIPETVEGHTVKSIGDRAFKGCAELISVVIPDGVEKIGEYSFSGCCCLESIVIPNSVKEIGYHAFRDCRDLTTITVPACVVETPNMFTVMFKDCLKTTYVTVADGATTIGDEAFRACIKLASVKLPDTITSIGESAFALCQKLTSVNIPNGVTSIGSEAFYGCIRMNVLILPNSVKSIGDWAFCECRGLISITIPGSIEKIGDSIFSSCPSVTIRSNGGMFSLIKKYADKNYLRYKKIK